jgi:hypothetical protein
LISCTNFKLTTLGKQFALAVDAAMEAIAENSLRFRVIYRNRRRAGVRRFPYGIIFELQEHQIVVTACFHGRRKPTRWNRAEGEIAVPAHSTARLVLIQTTWLLAVLKHACTARRLPPLIHGN